jgi:hypothetical protein
MSLAVQQRRPSRLTVVLRQGGVDAGLEEREHLRGIGCCVFRNSLREAFDFVKLFARDLDEVNGFNRLIT